MKVLLLGTATYVVLMVLAFIYFAERTIVSDIAFHTVHLIHGKKLFIQNNRFGALFTQEAVLTAIRLHASLKQVLVTYSESFIVLQATVFLLSIVWFRQARIALAMLLFSILITLHTFYWIQSELPQGLSFFMLTLAFVLSREKQIAYSIIEYIVLLVLCLFLVFFHPLMMIPALFVLGYFYLSATGSIQRKRFIIFGLSFFVLLILKKLFVTEPQYDAGATGRIKNFITLFPHYFDTAANKMFIKNCLNHYYLLVIGAVAVAATYLYQKRYMLLGWFIAFFAGYLAIVNVSYYDITSESYIENLYLPLVFILVLPLAFDVLWKVIDKWYFVPVMMLAIGIRLYDIPSASVEYTQRLGFYSELLADTKGKLIIEEKQLNAPVPLITWSASDEVLLLSALHDADSARGIYIDGDISYLRGNPPANNVYVSKWYRIPFKELDKHYFNFSDTSAYVVYTGY